MHHQELVDRSDVFASAVELSRREFEAEKALMRGTPKEVENAKFLKLKKIGRYRPRWMCSLVLMSFIFWVDLLLLIL